MNYQVKGEVLYLFVSELGPEPSHGSVIGVLGEERRLLPDLIDVFKNDEGLADGLAVVQQERYLLVYGVVLEE